MLYIREEKLYNAKYISNTSVQCKEGLRVLEEGLALRISLKRDVKIPFKSTNKV